MNGREIVWRSRNYGKNGRGSGDELCTLILLAYAQRNALCCLAFLFSGTDLVSGTSATGWRRRRLHARVARK